MTNELQKRSDIIELRNNISLAVKESKAVMIFSQDQVDKAGFYIKKYSQLNKSLESIKRSIVNPIKDEIKQIDNFFKSLWIDSSQEEIRLKNEVNEFLIEKQRKEKEERDREQKELEDSIISDAEIFNDESILENIPQVEIKTEKIGAISENITSVRYKKWRLIDINKVPIEFLTVDERLMNQERQEWGFEDKSPIPGIEFYFEEKTRIK